jgi:hypothetical protein
MTIQDTISSKAGYEAGFAAAQEAMKENLESSYVRGYNEAKDRFYSHAAEQERKSLVSVIFIIATALAAVIIAGITYAHFGAERITQEITQREQLTSDAQVACLNNGGIWANSTCSWSKEAQ